MASIPTSMLHMSFIITSEYNNYLVIFVKYNISFHQYCDVKYYELNILGLKTTTLGYMLSSISIHIIMRIWQFVDIISKDSLDYCKL